MRIFSSSNFAKLFIVGLSAAMMVGAQRPTMSRQECVEDNGGVIVGDIGNGAIHRDDYVCESSGQPPIATILPAEGEPIATEGEVCCAAAATMSRQECISNNGIIVGDIGDGDVLQPDYVCESSGQPPIATIVPADGEPIATEGEVCCASSSPSSTDGETSSNNDNSAGVMVSMGHVVARFVVAFLPVWII